MCPQLNGYNWSMRPDSESLRSLYVEERKTTREIGALCGVSKTQVVRWLKAEGIDRRAANRGLLNRGIPEPTADDLRRLVHVEHRSYREVAALFGVDPSAVMHWLKRHGIERPNVWETRRAGIAPAWPDDAVLVRRYESGERVNDIAAEVGVSRPTVIARLKRLCVAVRRDGYDGGKRFPCDDGHSVRSVYEQRVCNWLSEHGIQHAYEPRLPWDRRAKADFLANGWYVEIWGVQGSPSYAAQQARKQAAYRSHGVALVEINHFDFSSQKRGRWRRLLAVTSTPAAHALPLLRT